MKYLIASLLALLSLSLLSAQTPARRAVLNIGPHQMERGQYDLPDGRIYSAWYQAPVPLNHIEPFLAFSIVWESQYRTESDIFYVRFNDGQKTLPPVYIQPGQHARKQEGRFISELYFTEKNVESLELRYIGRSDLANVTIHFFNPGQTENPAPSVHSEGSRMACPCPQPDYLDRNGWCPDGSCPEDPTPVPTTVTHLIVHHSAGTNTSSDWAAVVRSIYDYHVDVNNWDDIGYNWLIDPNGIIYQGRADNVRGAHFCGTNTGTMGVCVMGNFTNVSPAPPAVESLQNLLAWKACDAGLEATGEAYHNSSGLWLHHISGHRDGCATQCPGNNFYPDLPNIRNAVQFKMDHECNALFIAPPSDLSATLSPDNNILLNWTDNADNETGYRIERSSILNNNFNPIADLPANSTSYQDAAADPFTTHYYRVKATLADSSSTYSNEALYTPPSATHHQYPKSIVQLFPNPASHSVYLSLENDFYGNMEITVLDLLGRQQTGILYFNKKTKKINANIDVSSLPNGLYLINISQAGKTENWKLNIRAR